MKQRLTEPYQGYFRQQNLQPDLEITQTGPKTPGGEYLRRAWQPVALSEEVGEHPLLVEIMGEELVLFKTTKGVYGLVEKHCAHRGASLE